MNFNAISLERVREQGRPLGVENSRGRLAVEGNVTAIVTAMTDGERPFLAACIESVIQDEEIAAVIVCIMDSNRWIDGVLESFGQDPRIKILRMSLDLPGVVRNEAVKHVETEWIAFCDGDDVWCEGKTALQLAQAEALDADFVAGDHYLTDEAGCIRAVALAKYLPMTSAWLVRTSVMQLHPFRDVEWEDHEWWFRTKNAFKRVRCPKLLLRYRVRGQSVSTVQPSKARKVRVVTWGSKPVIGLGVLLLTWGMWLLNRRRYYCHLEK